MQKYVCVYIILDYLYLFQDDKDEFVPLWPSFPPRNI